MNYQAIYARLVEMARGRKRPQGYSERHHILPRCMGGGNERANIVRLTAEEHYVAHQLLVRIYPTKKGLALAAHRMAMQCTGRRAYGWLRRRMAEDAKGRKLSDEQRQKMLERMRTPEYRARVAATQNGKRYSEESRLKMSLAKKGKRRSPEHIKRSADGLRGRKVSDETKAKIAAKAMGNKRCLGKTIPPEVRLKMSIAQKRRFGTI